MKKNERALAASKYRKAVLANITEESSYYSDEEEETPVVIPLEDNKPA